LNKIIKNIAEVSEIW